MVVNKMKKYFKHQVLNDKGQAIFELILFLPFLMFLYTIYYTVGNSISGSINQQKAVRGYFYALVKGNSYITPLPDLKSFRLKGVTRVGFNSVGWVDHLDGTKSFAPCFQFSTFLKNGSTEKCDDSTRAAEGSSSFIRLFTYYGVCGPMVTKTTQDPDAFDINPSNQASSTSCTLGDN